MNPDVFDYIGKNKMIKIASETEILQFFRKTYAHHKQQYFGFYNSLLGKVITEEHLMLLPADERIATRAHGVFDVVYMKQLRLINLDQHIARLHKSALSASIQPPFPPQQMKDLVVQVVQSVVDYHLRNDPQGTKKKIISQNVCIRLTISSGFGDFSVASLGKEPVLYIVVFEPYFNDRELAKGVKEYVTKIVDKPKDLVHSKTIDYIDNAIMANLAKAKGGYQGIKALSNGVLLEAATANIGFVFGREFATPRFQTVIEGTTIKKCLNYLQQLVEEGVLDKISERDITVAEGEKADEMIVFGGDKVVPVLEFNDKRIGQQKGPIARSIQEWYGTTNKEGTTIRVAPELM